MDIERALKEGVLLQKTHEQTTQLKRDLEKKGQFEAAAQVGKLGNMFKLMRNIGIIVFFMIVLPGLITITLVGYLFAFILTFFDPIIYKAENRVLSALEHAALSWIYIGIYLLYRRKLYVLDIKRSRNH